MWNALLSVAPGLRRAARVARASTSSGLYRTDTGEQFESSGGAHHYVLVKDAGDIKRFLSDLHDRCWNQGLGWHLIGRAGQLLDRSLVDRMVGYGERLCFEGAPVIEQPLAQDAAKRAPESFEGETIDTELVVPRLTEYERHLVEEATLGKAASEIRAQHDGALAEAVSGRSGMPLLTALRLIKARHQGVLLPYIELDFDHLGMVPVATVLAEPERFVGETLADPLEGAEYGRCKAKVMRDDGGGLFIHSFAHGRAIYRLRHDARSAKAAIAQAPKDGLIDYSDGDRGHGRDGGGRDHRFRRDRRQSRRNRRARGDGAYHQTAREREQAQRKAATAAQADGRIIRQRPDPTVS